ncbi:GTP-binding protein TrmE N-terminus-domain-containing protein [Xylaria sp. FL0933]|nr:GTP-binding protein TrmE N-terminus-domain-containing protein [Xylaria sp. FL0933]
MHRIATRRALGQSLCSYCRKAATRRTVGFIVTPSYRPLTAPFSASQRQRPYHTPSQVTPTYDLHHNDTIYALSSAEGKAGIAVIRISGPSCIQIYHKLCPNKKAPQPRYATVRTLYVPGVGAEGSEILDSAALVLYFPAPQTVTGEDVLELHVHGGSATVKAVLSAIPKCGIGNGSSIIRYAEPGEFTRRAFENDRLDLAQVEALSETLAAETEQQRRAAVRGSSGALGRTYEGWRRKLLEARAEMEALIDFQEDQHFDESPASLVGGVSRQVRDILEGIKVHEMASQRTELLRNGIQVALLGPPNAGKSSLMNQIVGREASIVSGESGTTRDIVEANLDIRGYLCTFADTAGFRSATAAAATTTCAAVGNDHATTTSTTAEPEMIRIGAVEEEGIRRARTRAVQSDVIIVLASVEERPAGGSGGGGGHEVRYDMETLRLAAACPQRLVLINKIDTIPDEADLGPLVRGLREDVLKRIPGLEDVVPTLISCEEARARTRKGKKIKINERKQKQSSDQLRQQQQDPGGVRLVVDRLVLAFQNMTELPAGLQDLHGVTERQRQLLVQCRNSLEEYVEVTEGVHGEDYDHDAARDIDLTMAAEHLRYAASCLGRITGRGEAGDVEEILGVIFEKFCVGK